MVVRLRSSQRGTQANRAHCRWTMVRGTMGQLPVTAARSSVAQALVVTAKVLAACGFFAAVAALCWWMFPRSAGRVSGSTSIYPGGMTSWMITGSYGTAWLELGEDAVVVRGRGPFRFFIRWVAPYGDISGAKAARAPGKSGLLLSGPGGNVAFWTPRWVEVLDLLELRAVPVSRTPSKVRRQDLAPVRG
jgi:hypothetical protein